MQRTHTCGELRIGDVNKEITLSGWVQRQRDKGSLLWIDLRDRYGVTQLFLEEGKSEASLIQLARTMGREYVIKVTGIVAERLDFKHLQNSTFHHRRSNRWGRGFANEVPLPGLAQNNRT